MAIAELDRSGGRVNQGLGCGHQKPDSKYLIDTKAAIHGFRQHCIAHREEAARFVQRIGDRNAG
ncbi:hypothetical protein EMIT0347P_130037 [Pseudomonas sp. IT-347P]